MMNSERPRLLCLLRQSTEMAAFLEEATRWAHVDVFVCGELGWTLGLLAGGVPLRRQVEKLRPDAIVLFASDNWRPMLKLWWETRRIGFQGLRCVVDLSKAVSVRNTVRYIRWGLLDAATFAQELPVRVAQLPEQRVRFGFSAVAAARFIATRLRAEARSILWVDPNICEQSPSMRSLVWSAASLIEKGWELRCWCNESSVPAELAETIIFPRIPGPSVVKMLGFFLGCNLFYRARTWLLGKGPAALIHTTCANLLAADVASVHFCVPAWREIERDLPKENWRDWLLSPWLSLLSGHLERIQLSSPSLRLIAPVSKGIEQAVRRHHRVTAPEFLLPNAYDEQRFSPEVRARFRAEKREELGFADDLFVFAFTSQGHYRRKGFWLVIEALALVPEQWAQKVRLLVIGGTPRQVGELRRHLAEKFPTVKNAVCLVGRQPQVEHYLAAADAFVFPTYFESFGLAECEAAAMGLPLLVSDHYGVEMFLKEGENGWLVQCESSDIAAKILQLMSGDLRVASARFAGQALTRQEFTCRVDQLYNSLLPESDSASFLRGDSPGSGRSFASFQQTEPA